MAAAHSVRLEAAARERPPAVDRRRRERDVAVAGAHPQPALQRRRARRHHPTDARRRRPRRGDAALGPCVRTEVGVQQGQQPFFPRRRRLHLLGRQDVLVDVGARLDERAPAPSAPRRARAAVASPRVEVRARARRRACRPWTTRRARAPPRRVRRHPPRQRRHHCRLVRLRRLRRLGVVGVGVAVGGGGGVGGQPASASSPFPGISTPTISSHSGAARASSANAAVEPPAYARQ